MLLTCGYLTFPNTLPYRSMDVNAMQLPKGIYVVMLTDAFGKLLVALKIAISITITDHVKSCLKTENVSLWLIQENLF